MTNKILAILLVLLLLGSGTIIQAQGNTQTDDLIHLRVINTTDEHGWLQPFTAYGSTEVQGGAANVYAQWTNAEGYDPDSTLILSSGDNWTGPAISTWFQGEPVVQAFNRMGYAATAIGNHDFDFGRDVLEQHITDSDYAYLSANIVYATDGSRPDFATPYLIEEINGVQIGIIGLANINTPTSTHPDNINDLLFTDYDTALSEVLPEVQAAGADIVVVLAHACVNELGGLATEFSGDVDVIFGGHCHMLMDQELNGVTLLGSGWAWRNYAQVDITYDPAADSITDIQTALIDVSYEEADDPAFTPDPELEELIADWQAEADAVLNEEIGYTTTGIPQRDATMFNLVTDAWLAALPEADAAITNTGGFRQEIPAGPVTVASIVGVLPFDNRLIEVTVTGEELAENLACCGGAVGGFSYDQRTITWLDGRPFDPAAEYTVLISDFMYAGGDGYLFGEQDPDAYDTGIDWRQPVLDWLRAHPTTTDNPLENVIDDTPRMQ